MFLFLKANPLTKLFLACAVLILLDCTFVEDARADVVYSNDFDGNVINGGGTSTTISGGTNSAGGIAGGVTYSQGYDGLNGFSGDFWRIAAPNDVLEFSIQNVTNSEPIDVEFSLAMMDSWDGTSGVYGEDIINIAIFDGATQIAGISEPYGQASAPSSNVDQVVVQNQQLGFNNGPESWWNDDGYRMSFRGLNVSSSNLRIQFWGSSAGTGQGFQGGNDESFAVDNLIVTSVPEPVGVLFALAGICALPRRRRIANDAAC